jgi:8-oxo-dGTP diphosphatase
MIGKALEFCYEYPRVAHTVDAIVVVKNPGSEMILLIQRKFDPYMEMWALPGGFIGMEETLLQACQRELFEETGLEVLKLTQFYTFDAVDRDPRHRTISTAFYGTVQETHMVTGGDDAVRAEWFPIDSLPELAFDHADIIRKYVEEIR